MTTLSSVKMWYFLGFSLFLIVPLDNWGHLTLDALGFLAHLVMSLCNHASVHHVVLSLVLSSSSASFVYSPPSDSFDHRNFYILQMYVSIPLVYAHEILSQCDVYFSNGSHFSKFHYMAILSTWLKLEPSYMV